MRVGPVALLLALVAGCSIVNDPAMHMGGAAPINDDELCARLTALECSQYFRCCSTASTAIDMDTCVRANQPGCEMTLGGYLLDHRTGYDPMLAGQIVAEGEALSAACSLDIAHWVSTREGLFGAFAGTVEPGGDCTPTSGSDYAAFLACDRLESSCVPSAASSFVCAGRHTEGQGCFLNGDCEDGLACVRSVPTDPSGTCTSRLGTGAICRQATDCVSYLCHIPTGLMVGTCADATQDNVYCGVMD